MKRAMLFSLMAAVLVLAACSPAASQAPAASQPPAADVSQSSSSGGTEVDVTLADNTIQSSMTTFKAGVPYRFVIVNNGNHQHNFNINPPVSAAGSLDAALSQALLTVTTQQLPQGGGTTVTYTFPASAVGKQLEMSCLIRRHYEDGMHLSITVTN